MVHLEHRDGRPIYVQIKESLIAQVAAGVLLPGDKPFKTKELSRQIGSSRLSFADGTYMEQFLDITPGSLSILGLMNDRDGRVRLLIDEDVLKAPFVGCHPCVNTASLRLKTEDLLQFIIPAMGHEPTMVQLPYQIEE